MWHRHITTPAYPHSVTKSKVSLTVIKNSFITALSNYGINMSYSTWQMCAPIKQPVIHYRSGQQALALSTMPLVDDWLVALTQDCLPQGHYMAQTIRQCLWSQPDVKTFAISVQFHRSDPLTNRQYPSCSQQLTTVILLNTSTQNFYLNR